MISNPMGVAIMEILKTYLFFEDFDPGNPYLIDTISLGGQWWLVATWLQSNTTGERTPERLVRLTGLRFEEAHGQPYRFRLHNSVPKSVFDGRAQAGFVVATYQALSQSPPPKKNPH